MPVIHVDSVDDPRLDDYRNLTDVALRRRLEPQHGLYMAEGAKVIGRAVTAGHRPRSVLLTHKWLDSVRESIGDLSEDVTVYVAAAQVLEAVTGYDVHRGALAAMNRPALPSLDQILATASTLVVLESIVDHTNVGAIFRSVAGLGADAVIVAPSCADPLYRRSVKVSMGTVFQVPWTRSDSWPEDLELMRRSGFTVAGLALDERAISLRDFAASGHDKVALVLGAEGDGLTRDALSHTDVTVTIPMAHGVDSLNVAAASAVAMWALRRT